MRPRSPPPGASPADHLPSHIRHLTHFGERADFSHDGTKTLFLSKMFGDVQKPGGPGNLDLWKLALDGSGSQTRLTHFTDFDGYKATNGVVSDDGRWMAFQMGFSGDEPGIGHGVFLMDLGAVQ